MKSLIFLLLLLIPLFGISQSKFDYDVSTPYRVIDGAEKYYFSTPKDGIVLSAKRDGKDIYIQRFDANTMKETARNKFSDMPQGFVIEYMGWFKDRAFCYFSVWDKKNTTEQLFYRELDFKNCGFKGKEKRIIAVKGKLTGAPVVTMGWWSMGVVDKFSFLMSHDSSKLLIQCRKKPEKRNDAINHDIIGMYVFDEDLNQITGNEVKMPYTEKRMDNIDYHINSEGIPHILAKVRKDDSGKDYVGVGKNKEANYNIELFRVDIPNSKIKATKINVEGYFLKDIWMYDGPDNAMICSGFYNNIKTSRSWDNADGIFLFRMKEEGGIKTKNFYEIPLEIINQYEKAGVQKRNENKEKKDKAEFSNLQLRRVVVQNDNSIIIAGETYYRVYHRTSNGGGYYTYHYEDMLMTKISPEGELLWMKKLPKKQSGRRPRGGLGFKYIALDGNHYLVFLDNVKNMTLGLDQRAALHMDGAGGYLTAYKINDATGKVSKVSIFDTKNVRGGLAVKQFHTGRILQVGEEEFIIELYKGQKEDVMIKIKVE